jgi:uncharacterized membrane protein YukC
MRAAGARDPCIRRAIIIAGLVFAFGLAVTPRGFVSSFAGDVSEALQEAQRQFNAGNYSAAITTLQSIQARLDLMEGWPTLVVLCVF